jgi:hypothetical protein
LSARAAPAATAAAIPHSSRATAIAAPCSVASCLCDRGKILYLLVEARAQQLGLCACGDGHCTKHKRRNRQSQRELSHESFLLLLLNHHILSRSGLHVRPARSLNPFAAREAGPGPLPRWRSPELAAAYWGKSCRHCGIRATRGNLCLGLPRGAMTLDRGRGPQALRWRHGVGPPAVPLGVERSRCRLMHARCNGRARRGGDHDTEKKAPQKRGPQ